jgi:hypothetical protein
MPGALTWDPDRPGGTQNNWRDAQNPGQANGLPLVDQGLTPEAQAIAANALAVTAAGAVLRASADRQSWAPVSGDGQANASGQMPAIGPNLAPSTGWTAAGWVSAGDGAWTHSPGNTLPLSVSVPGIVAGTDYAIVLTVSARTAGWVNPGVGGSAHGNGSGHYLPDQPDGAWPAETHFIGVKATSTGGLVLTPNSVFDGTVSAISVHQVIGVADAYSSIQDADGGVSVETRVATQTAGATYYGRLAGAQGSFSALGATAFGVQAMEKNIGGALNTAVGFKAMRENRQGRANTAIGAYALQNNTSGDQLTAIGCGALQYNTTGFNNLAVGVEALVYNTTGSYNTAIGPYDTMLRNTTGSNNVAIGHEAMYENLTGSSNVAVGFLALRDCTAVTGATAVGFQAGRKTTTGINTAVGSQALTNATTSSLNTAVGKDAAVSLATGGGSNCAFGHMALYAAVSAAYNTAIGAYALRFATGAGNTALGLWAGYNLTSGKSNVAIGAFVNVPSNTADGQLNIGCVLYGAGLYDGTSAGETSSTPTASGRIGIGVSAPAARLHLAAGAAAAGRAPLKLEAGTNLTTPENGTLEYDGTSLYFTVGGVRRTVSLV